jgi:hypothetical protein
MLSGQLIVVRGAELALKIVMEMFHGVSRASSSNRVGASSSGFCNALTKTRPCQSSTYHEGNPMSRLKSTACPEWKALPVRVEDGYHANIDVSCEIAGHRVNKRKPRHATVLP